MTQANPKHPIQPLMINDRQIKVFKENKLVSELLKRSGLDWNDIVSSKHSGEDIVQLFQLCGRSVSMVGDMHSCGIKEFKDVSDIAENMDLDNQCQVQAENVHLKEELSNIKAGLRIAATAAWGFHEDDLE
ncbi:conserved hypothetical protein [Vibrio chagasii]|nr:conserved hypothetical protein [Vibrio chagasii]